MIVAFVQARMGSSRLPAKVLKPIDGKPMLWHLWWRLSQAKTIDRVVVATGDKPGNQPILDFGKEYGVPVFVGSEDDLVDRIYQAAQAYKADTIAAVTGDCPLLDPEITDQVVREYQRGGVDLCATSPSYTFPDGFGTEVFSLATLEKVHAAVQSPMEREHLTQHIRRRPNQFKLRFVENGSYHPFTDLHLSVDDEDDFELVRRIFEALLPDKPLFHFKDVVEVLLQHPEWVKEHPPTPINEGLYRSLLADANRPRPVGRDLTLTKSFDLLKRSRERIPSATQTFSKGYTQFVYGVSPIFIESGKGALVYDVDGNEFIDQPLGLGATSLGHCHPEVDEAVIAQVRKGPNHSLPHRLEVEVAERLSEIIPCAEMARFGKNGSDATSGAVRVARAITGRELILCCGYHGWQDWYIGTTTRKRGVPRAVQELTVPFPYGDLQALERLFADHHHKVAAIIMEPVGTVAPDYRYLSSVKEIAHRNGALLIFDEVVTGFKMALGGGQQYFGVTPDMACIGKGMANGYPVSAIVGPKEVMEEFDRSFFSFTFGGEAVSLAAALATINVMDRDNVISHMWILGSKLKNGYNYLARKYGLYQYTWCQGFPPRAINQFRDKSGKESLLYKSVFQQECIRRGVLFNAAPKICAMTTNDQIEYTIAVYDEAFKVLQKAYESSDPERFLLGKPVEPVFRQSDY